MSTFGELLKRKRKYNGLTQENVAEKMGVSTTTIQNWERGKQVPRRDKIDSIAEIYDLSKKELSEALYGDEAERKDNWPDFLFDQATNDIISELYLNRNQQELFGLLVLYNEDFLRMYSNTQSIIDDNIDLKKIPYLFINQVGSINSINLAEGLRRVLYEVRSDFLLKYIKKNPEEEFSIRKMTKEDICEFIAYGCQDHLCEDFEGLLKPDSDEYYPCLNIYENLAETIANLQSVDAKGGKIFWCNVPDMKSRPRWITYDNIPEGFNSELMDKVFRRDLDGEYGEKTRLYSIEGQFNLLEVQTEQVTEGFDVYIVITDKGRKVLEWYNS